MLPRIILLVYAACTLLASAVDPDSSQATMKHKFIWLMQGKEALDLSFLRSDQSDAIQVLGTVLILLEGTPSACGCHWKTEIAFHRSYGASNPSMTPMIPSGCPTGALHRTRVPSLGYDCDAAPRNNRQRGVPRCC